MTTATKTATDEPVDDWTADDIRKYGSEPRMLRTPGEYRGYFVGAVAWKERVARMVARDRLLIAERTAALAAAEDLLRRWLEFSTQRWHDHATTKLVQDTLAALPAATPVPQEES